ncbi:hypothetical protein [Enterobacter quasiroggenkampii]|uniref:hypothetical protein n=1 Tax=Enterobacter quasiroggenkampii TaxID=2497436 RepID=UPI0021D3139A|nr:hypothetical protein [Enterobacter quasiroggenkampii]MCU6278389.1 hypothetical protein [Enterobacter quasiroggenkampii]
MNIFIQRCILGLIATVTMLLFSAPTMALSGRTAGEQMKMNINISGTVVATGSCTFNSGSGGSLTFAPVWENVTYSIDNGFELIGEYSQVIDSAMTCSGDTNGTAKMMFTDVQGDGVDFNGHKLLSFPGISFLGLEIYVNGVIQDVGTPFNVDMSDPPQLEAKIVQVETEYDIDLPSRHLVMAETLLTMEFQ